MNTDNKQLPIKREDYESMLQHAVAVIEHARMEVAMYESQLATKVDNNFSRTLCLCLTALNVAQMKTAPLASSSVLRKTVWKWNLPLKTWASR